MSITVRRYTGAPASNDSAFQEVRDFLRRINRERLASPLYAWGRWEWMHTHSGLDASYLDRIGLWEDDGRIVALCTYDCIPGEAFFCVEPGYEHLKPEMLAYAREHLSKDGALRAYIADSDREFQRVAVAQGFRATQDRDQVSVIDIDPQLDYSLPQGFRIVSMADGWDWEQYHRCMWRGFNHKGEPDMGELPTRRQMLSGMDVNPELVIAVATEEGRYVSHCGMWYLPGDSYAYVEPVATDPDFRRMGLGRAAVLEGVHRCGNLGARQALVGSTQQFYYDIGFYPLHGETVWEPVK